MNMYVRCDFELVIFDHMVSSWPWLLTSKSNQLVV